MTKPRSTTADDPAMSVSAPATRPPVQDSAVATMSFFDLQSSSRAIAAASVSRSAMAQIPLPGPGQAYRGGRHGNDAFPAAGEAELFAGRRLHRDALDRHLGDLGDLLADHVAVRTDARRFAHDGEIEMGDLTAAFVHPLDREFQELVGRRAAPAWIVRREMLADVAVGERAENGID